MPQKVEKVHATLGECGISVSIGLWFPWGLLTRQHVADHVANPLQGWQSLTPSAANLDKQLEKLGCARKEHKKGQCKAFAECDKLVGQLGPFYLQHAKKAITDGAQLPRHTHNEARRTGKKTRKTSWFLSSSGVLAETYELSGLRTAYRVNLTGRPCSDEEYVYMAKEYVRQRPVAKLYHSATNWSSARPASPLGRGAIAEAFERAKRRPEEGK